MTRGSATRTYAASSLSALYSVHRSDLQDRGGDEQSSRSPIYQTNQANMSFTSEAWTAREKPENSNRKQQVLRHALAVLPVQFSNGTACPAAQQKRRKHEDRGN